MTYMELLGIIVKPWMTIEDITKVGDILKVQVIEIDDKGKVKVSRRNLIEKPAGYVEKPATKKHFDKKGR